MSPDFDNIPPDERFDAAIRDALRLEQDADQLARLQRYWRSESQRDRWRRRALPILIPMAAAAAVLVIAFLWPQQKLPEVVQIAPEQPQIRRESAPAEPPVIVDSPPPQPTESAGRAPTAYEQLVFAARTHVEFAPKSVAIARSTGESDDERSRIRRLLAADSPDGIRAYLSLVRNDATRSVALAVAKDSPNFPTGEFIGLLDDKDEPVRIAAALVLGYVNGPETTRLLIARVTEQPSDSAAAWLALMSSRGEMAQEFLQYAARRPQLLGHFNNARNRYGHFTSYLAKEKPSCVDCAG